MGSLQNKSGSKPFFLILMGVAIGWLSSRMFRPVVENANATIQTKADKKIQNLIGQMIARKVGRSSEEVAALLDDPDREPELYQRIRAQLRDCTLRFDLLENSRARLTIHIDWGKDERMTISQSWNWSELPIEIRQALLENGSQVFVSWDMPA